MMDLIRVLWDQFLRNVLIRRAEARARETDSLDIVTNLKRRKIL